MNYKIEYNKYNKLNFERYDSMGLFADRAKCN